MANNLRINPAEIAAQKALNEMYECIRTHQNFRLEAGAGAGKTYSLAKALLYIINENANSLLRKNKKVACITYTNIATDEIISRTDGHPVIYASTIHSFCWQLIKSFQPILRDKVSELAEWSEKIEEIGSIGDRNIQYDLGYRHVEEDMILLHHDDVLNLIVELMEIKKFREIFTARFPVLFIDEYQDTDKEFAESILKHFIEPNEGPFIGLFGDSWQKIYSGVSGLIEHGNLKLIGKEANFRSVKEIVNVLNRMRPELPQDVKDTEATGSIVVYHSNNWTGERLSGAHWAGDLPLEIAHIYLNRLRQVLENDSWDFSPEKTKILMLTHNVLASEQDYRQIADVFPFKESFIKKENPYIEFLVDAIEPACKAYQNGKYGEMFSVLGASSVNLKNHEDKLEWVRSMNTLINYRENNSIREVLDFLKLSHRPRLPEKIVKLEDELRTSSQDIIDDSSILTQIRKLRVIPYKEIMSLAQFVNDHTPFSTKHGVKGAEFENVLVVFGRGWNKYNWNQYLEWFPDRFPDNRKEFYENNRNLFYVVCSRPKTRLALLFTQRLSVVALRTLNSWFGEEFVKPLIIEN